MARPKLNRRRCVVYLTDEDRTALRLLAIARQTDLSSLLHLLATGELVPQLSAQLPVVVAQHGAQVGAQLPPLAVGISRTHADKIPSLQSVSSTVTQEKELIPFVPDLFAGQEPPEVKTPPEPREPEEEPVMVFPIKGKVHDWGLTERKRLEYVETYPGLDVDGELLRARQWCRDNPVRQKTSRGMSSFLGRWMQGAVDKPRWPMGVPASPAPPPTRDAATDRMFEEYQARCAAVGVA